MSDHIDRFLDAADLDVDLEDVHLDVQQLKQLASIRRLIRREGDKLMAIAEDILAAVQQADQDAIDAGNRVIDTLNADHAAIDAANATIAEDDAKIAALQAEIDAGTVTPEAAQAVLDAVAGVRTKLQAIDTAPVEPIPAPE